MSDCEQAHNLRNWLVREIRDVLDRKTAVPPLLLWLDPDSQWLDLLRAAAKTGGFDLWADPAQHELLVRDRFCRTPRAPRVVWLPCMREDITWFKPFELEAEAVWERTLLEAIREFGIYIPREHEVDLACELPAYAREWLDQPTDAWAELTPGNARGALIDDARMLQVLAGETGEFERLRTDGRFDFFANRAVNLSYIDKESGDEFFAECKEIGATRLIPEGPLPPGDIFSVGRDTANDRVALFRIQVAALPGNGRFQVVGVSAKAVKESARMAFDYLRANAKRVGLDRDLGAYDFNIQVISPTHGKDTADLGVAFYIAILSAIVNKPIAASLVVMGQMSIHGVLSRVEQLGDRLRVVMDAGARLVLIPTVNAADLGGIPPELLDKVRVDFYNAPAQAAFKAMEEA